MRSVYKHQLETKDVQYISVPGLAGTNNFKDQVLKIDVQNGIPYIWYLVDTKAEKRAIEIIISGTGYPLPAVSINEYLGSYMLHGGDLVFHVFVGL